MGSLYLLSETDVSSSLLAVLQSSSGADSLTGVRAVGPEAQPVCELAQDPDIYIPGSVTEIRWRGMGLEQLRIVEEYFAESVLKDDPMALLWDLYNKSLHTKEMSHCLDFPPVIVPFSGRMCFEGQFEIPRRAQRRPSGELLERLASDFPFLFPRSYGEYEPLRRIAAGGRATIDGFAELWDAGANLIWSSKAGWQGYAHVVEPLSATEGPLTAVNVWRKKAVTAPDVAPAFGSDVLAGLAELFGAAVGRSRWITAGVGPTPWPHSALAPQGWWLGFDGTPHAAVYADSRAASELRPEFHDASGWQTQDLDRGALLAVAERPVMPPAQLVASLAPHTVPAEVRPASLLETS
jgi:hypothetical protein